MANCSFSSDELIREYSTDVYLSATMVRLSTSTPRESQVMIGQRYEEKQTFECNG